MPRHAAFLGLLGCAALAWLTAGCHSSQPCVPDIDSSGRYRIDVVERYDEQSTFTFTTMLGHYPGWTSGRCAGAAEPIGAGASLTLEGTGVHGRMQGLCDSVSADISSPPAGLTLSGPATSVPVRSEATGPLSAIFSMSDVMFGGCSGTLALGVFGSLRAGDIFLDPVPGSEPPAVLYEVFAPVDPSDAACPSCYDDLVIHFSKL